MADRRWSSLGIMFVVLVLVTLYLTMYQQTDKHDEEPTRISTTNNLGHRPLSEPAQSKTCMCFKEKHFTLRHYCFIFL